MKAPIKGLRWYVAGMLCLASELNYLDRQTLSVLAQTIQDHLGLTTEQYADITSWFLASYTIMYAVSGRIIDRLGTRVSFLIFVAGWSAATMLHGIAQTAFQLSLFRFLLGATEAAIIPGGTKAVAEWFPPRERLLATGVFNAGTAVGGAIAAPLVAWIALTWTWRHAFVVSGLLGFLWLAVWVVFYRLPRQHPRISADELQLIEAERGSQEEPATVPLTRLLGLRAVWGCMLVRMVTDPVSYFFLFWIPKYLQQERGFDLADVGKYSWIPFVAIALGNVVGGALPGWLMRLGWSYNRARKTVMLCASCIIPLCFVALVRVPDVASALTLLSAAMFSHAAWLSIGLPGEIFPAHVVGTISGLSGCLGGVMGIISQQLIGWTVQHVSYTPIFMVGSVLHLTSFVIVGVLIGKLGVLRHVAAAPAPSAAS